MRPRILVDSDGVVADLEWGWLDWYRRCYDHTMTSEVMFRAWDVAQNVPIGDRVYDAFKEPGFFYGLASYTDQLMWLQKLNEIADVVIATDCGGEPNAAFDKLRWYECMAPFLDVGKQVVITGQKWLMKADAMVDDKLLNITNFIQPNQWSAADEIPIGFYIRRQHGKYDDLKLLPGYIINEVSGLQQVYEYYAK